MNFSRLMQLSDKTYVVKKMITAAYLKIFMNYSQTISIMNSLQLNWDGKLLQLFSIYKSASGGFQQVISIECFITGFKSFKYFIIFFLKQRFECNSLLQSFDAHLLAIRV